MMIFKHVSVGKSDVKTVHFGQDLPFSVLAGPCVMESRSHVLMMAHNLREISEKTGVPIVFKTSFDKANRTSQGSYRGVSLEDALPIFQDVRSETKMPVITDVHSPEQCHLLKDVVDILQIPAFLCRQTDLLIAAGETGLPINIKKGQFLAPWDMANVAEKVLSTGNDQIMLCERGVSFGYNTLVSDMRSIPIMAQTGYPIIFDGTHSVQQPGGQGKSSGGDRRFVEPLVRAALSIGVAGVFMEVHDDPNSALSDGPNMIALKDFEGLLLRLKKFDQVAKAHPLDPLS
jgi:2-dehydro-3-deoxyphosphooctonate aldolase (KDO 8-P synthase)